MNPDQVASLGRGLWKWVGGAIVGWAVARYELSPADASALSAILEAGAGVVVAFVGFVLSHRTHKVETP